MSREFGSRNPNKISDLSSVTLKLFCAPEAPVLKASYSRLPSEGGVLLHTPQQWVCAVLFSVLA